jgi:hypothetical protein
MGQPQEISINTLPFWSRFTVSADLRYDGINPTRTVISKGRQIPVFDYRQGEGTVTALEGAQATTRDTILVQANQTRGGGLYRIHGISYTKDGWPYSRTGADAATVTKGLEHSFYPPNSLQPANGTAGPIVLTVEDFRALDSLMVHIYLDAFRTQINIDGTRRILEMGPSPLYPGVGGAATGNVDTSNGQSFVSNYMHISEGIVWNPAGAVDSNLRVLLEASYDIVVPCWTAPNGLAPDGTPIPSANPTAMGRVWTAGWICNFHGLEESPTSNVS